MSVFLSLSPPEKTENLTLLAGLAAARGIELALDEKVKATIKWPNDVHINGKKVAGVLAEGRALGNELSVVIGIGVNASQSADDFPDELTGRATSCYLATGRHPDRVRIVEWILNCLDEYTSNAQGADWICNWKARCEMFGKRYLFESAGKRLEAEIIDIDPERGLIVRDAAGAMHFLQSATTTIIPQ
jgi:BirA family biotin operon repressor/biotin-[acetyl-CoA-carboxylase] ligase